VITRYTRRQMLGLIAAGGAGAAGFGSLAACAPTSDDTGGGSTVDQDAPPEDFAFASWSLADDLSKAEIKRMMDTYGQQNGISVSGAPFDYDTYLNQLTLQVRGEEFTGAAQLDIAWLSALVALGKLRDLGPQAEGVDYTDISLTSGQLDGVQYGLPWSAAAIGLIANRELLDGAGIDRVPTSIEDFEAALVELKGAGVIPYAASTDVAQLKDILVWMMTFGSPLLEGDTVTLDDDACVEAVTWYKRLFDQKLIAPDVDRADARTLFSQAKTAMYDDASIGKDFAVAESPDPSLGGKCVPAARPVVATGDTPQAQQWGHIVVVVEGEGDHTAADFARWVTSDQETAVHYFEELGLPPTTESALASDAVQNDEFTTAFTEQITATSAPNPFWRFPQYAQMEAAVAEQVQAVLVGMSSPADAMATAQETVQGLID
jgi:multiple sugar transport system substrate-binding protein